MNDGSDESAKDQTMDGLGNVINNLSKESTNDKIQDGASIGMKDGSHIAAKDITVQVLHPKINDGSREGTNDGNKDGDSVGMKDGSDQPAKDQIVWYPPWTTCQLVGYFIT